MGAWAGLTHFIFFAKLPLHYLRAVPVVKSYHQFLSLVQHHKCANVLTEHEVGTRTVGLQITVIAADGLPVWEATLLLTHPSSGSPACSVTFAA